ncbi:MAG: TIGR03619 family F420-dependent LLM class oxidoreductase [Acidimicrobiia bacterium]
MDFGVFLPVSGRAALPDTLRDFTTQVEQWGFSAVWAADRIVVPWTIDTPYPYSVDNEFIVPPDRPFLEPLTVLAYLAGCTGSIRLGVSVVVMPYRHPLYWAKIATSIDRLSEGRLLLGVGVGWMREEFEALDASFEERGAISDEQLEILRRALHDDNVSFEGRFYTFGNVAFEPKATGRMPIWVGGEGKAARRRTARYGDAWFPYFVRITPEGLQQQFTELVQLAEANGRDPSEIELCCCVPIEVTEEDVPQEPDRLRGSPDQLASAVAGFRDAGVKHLALQFMVPRYPDRLAQIEPFAAEVMGAG